MAKRIRYEDRNPEPLIPFTERIKFFREYALGYSTSLALSEAQRCMICGGVCRKKSSVKAHA